MRSDAQAVPVDEDFALALLEFLEVAVHTVLWSRGVYPAELFDRVKFYGFKARRSRHPGLNNYISGVLTNLKAALKARCLHEVAIVFFDPSGRALERVTFGIKLPSESAGAGVRSTPDVAAVEAGLTSALLILSCTDSFSTPLPAGSTFELVAYSTSRHAMDLNVFYEDNMQGAELRHPLAAHVLKSLVIEGCLKMQVLLERPAPAGVGTRTTAAASGAGWTAGIQA